MKWILILATAGVLRAAQGLYFPTGADWAHVAPAAVGWNKDALNAALELAGARHSTSAVILHGGKILAERNWKDPVVAEDVAEDVASVQKSITSVPVTTFARRFGAL